MSKQIIFLALLSFLPHAIAQVLYNQAAYIPPQCYVKTQDSDEIYNPCFACHTESTAPNFINDGDTQLEYGFQDYSKRNRWTNLFKDRSKKIERISDVEIINYIRKSNYKDQSGKLLLDNSYLTKNKNWDLNRDGKWNGYIPDSYFRFDKDGFDLDNDNRYTGWRSYLYYPFPGLFVPSAGSFGDVLIRLPREFQLNIKGNFDVEIYKLNLAIVESLVKQVDVAIRETNESSLGIDLDGDNEIGIVNHIHFHQNAVDGSGMRYVGLAGILQESNKLKLAAGFFPLNTEFLHSVRYLDIDNENIVMSARFKELRYAKKVGWTDRNFHEKFSKAEAQERILYPQKLMTIPGNAEIGVFNGLGWKYQGFIEGKDGRLRPQSYEESMFCVGCHSAIGVLADSNFSFKRKVDHEKNLNDWGHWSQYKFQYIAEEVDERYKEYINKNKGLTDYRVKKIKNNEEIIDLFIPSEMEALQMNKSYKVIVDEQSFIKGRDANVIPIQTVHKVISDGQKTGITKPLVFK